MPTNDTPHQHRTADCASFLLFLREQLLDLGDVDVLVLSILEERLLWLAAQDQATQKMVAPLLHEAINPPLWTQER